MAGDFDGRVLRKGICKDRRVAKLKTAWAKLLYTWTIPFLDSLGRMEADPDLIQGMIFPRHTKQATLDNITDWLKDIHQVGLYFYYSVGGEWFLQCPTPEKNLWHRKGRERSSPFPPPPKDKYEKWLKEIRSHDSADLPDAPPQKKEKDPKKKALVDSWFEKSWKDYPLKIGKREAREHFLRSVNSEEKWNQFTKALRTYILSDRVKKGYIMDGKNFFKEWEDWLQSPEKGQGKEDVFDRYQRKKDEAKKRGKKD